MSVTTAGSTTGANNGTYTIVTAAAGTLTFATAQFTTAEAFIAATTLTGDNGGSWRTLFANCVIGFYSGSQPANADATEGSGTLLALITLSAGAFSGGTSTNGLNWGFVLSGTLYKPTDATWQGTGLVDGTASWFRVYDNNYTTGASTTAVRLDGSLAASGSNIVLSSTSIKVGVPITVDTFAITLPAA